MYVNIQLADRYQEFLNFMSQEHDLTLTISEMDEIVSEAQKLVEKLARPLVSKGVTKKYAEFCVECDRKGLPLLCLEDYITKYCC